jgi:putative ABC transport system permease protein
MSRVSAPGFYDLLLKLYPSEFRAHYGQEMRAVARARYAEERTRGFFGVMAFGLDLIGDALITSLQEHLIMLVQDIRFTIRTLRSSPAFAIAALLTIALGIGANTAIFSVVDHVLLRPLPFPNADRLLRVRLTHPTEHDVPMSVADFIDWRAQNRTFASLCAFADEAVTLTGMDTPRVLQAAEVTDQFFSTLGAEAAIGRAFHLGDGSPGAPLGVVLSHRLWMDAFGGRYDAVGKTVKLDSVQYAVIGIMPAGFAFPSDETQLWVIRPISIPGRRGPYFLTGIARMRSGTTFGEAVSQLNSSIFAATALSGQSGSKLMSFYVQPLQDAMVGQVRESLLILLGAVVLVLLIACVNVGNLLLSRSEAREREIALRIALGVNPGRLFRQLLTESLFLAGVGAAAGVALAYGAILWCKNAAAGYLPRLATVALDGRVLLFAAGITVISGILFGLAPALQAVRRRTEEPLRGGRATHGSRSGMRLRRVLIFGEVALACVLAIGASLLARSLLRLTGAPSGIRSDRLFTVELALPEQRYKDPEPVYRFFGTLLEAIDRIPGVESASASNSLPPDQVTMGDEFVFDTKPLKPGEPMPVAPLLLVTPDYFRTLGIPILQGRAFTDADAEHSPPVAIISRAMAQRYFPHENPVGRRIRQGGSERGNPWREIVGVAGDAKYMGLGAADVPVYYQPETQNAMNAMFLEIRTPLAQGTILRQVRTIVDHMDKDLALERPRMMDDLLSRSVSLPRMRTILIAAMAILALLLAAVGIYGVVAFSVGRRRSEMAVRIALGAQPGELVWLVVRESMQPVVCGVLAGIVIAAVLGKIVESLLFGIHSNDPSTFALASGVLTLIALAACGIPAIRAGRLDPAVTLRSE